MGFDNEIKHFCFFIRVLSLCEGKLLLSNFPVSPPIGKRPSSPVKDRLPICFHKSPESKANVEVSARNEDYSHSALVSLFPRLLKARKLKLRETGLLRTVSRFPRQRRFRHTPLSRFVHGSRQDPMREFS